MEARRQRRLAMQLRRHCKECRKSSPARPGPARPVEALLRRRRHACGGGDGSGWKEGAVGEERSLRLGRGGRGDGGMGGWGAGVRHCEDRPRSRGGEGERSQCDSSRSAPRNCPNEQFGGRSFLMSRQDTSIPILLLHPAYRLWARHIRPSASVHNVLHQLAIPSP